MSSTDARDTQVITRDAYRWFFIAGGAAVALALFLAATDYSLSHSDREQKLGAVIGEMRRAQTTMKGRVTDERQTEEFLYNDAAPVAESH